jgi:Zn-dependent protease with chaperone function
MPARMMGKAIAGGWKQTIAGSVIKFLLGFLLIGVLGVWLFWGFGYYIVFMLSPLAAPFVVQWAARASEKCADRIALDLGYGPASRRYSPAGNTNAPSPGRPLPGTA